MVYGDIDYMSHKFDFTYNNTGFSGLPDYVQKLRQDNIRYIIILVSKSHTCIIFKSARIPDVSEI